MSPEILGLVSLASLFIFIFVGFPIAIQGVSELLKSLFAAKTNVSLFEETAGSET